MLCDVKFQTAVGHSSKIFIFKMLQLATWGGAYDGRASTFSSKSAWSRDRLQWTAGCSSSGGVGHSCSHNERCPVPSYNNNQGRPTTSIHKFNHGISSAAGKETRSPAKARFGRPYCPINLILTLSPSLIDF